MFAEVDALFVLMNEREMWERNGTADRTTTSGPLFHFQTSPLPTFRPNSGPPPPKRKLDNYIVKAIVYAAPLPACGGVNIYLGDWAVIVVGSNKVNPVYEDVQLSTAFAFTSEFPSNHT